MTRQQYWFVAGATAVAAVTAAIILCVTAPPPDPRELARVVSTATQIECDVDIREEFGPRFQITLTGEDQLKRLGAALEFSGQPERRGIGFTSDMGTISLRVKTDSGAQSEFILGGGLGIEFGSHSSPFNYCIDLASSAFYNELRRAIEAQRESARKTGSDGRPRDEAEKGSGKGEGEKRCQERMALNES